MHRTPHPTAPQFGWVPLHDSPAPQVGQHLASTSPRTDVSAQQISEFTIEKRYGTDYQLYWTPFSGELPPTIVKRRCRTHRFHLGPNVKYPVMVALTVAALGSGNLLSAASTTAQAGPAKPDETGSFQAIDPEQSDFEVLATVSGESAQGVGGSTSYTVQPGDTVRGIAANFGLSTSTVIDANGLSNPDLIHPGQELYIPAGGGAAANSSVTVTVQTGDTVGKLAARYGVSASAIIDYQGNDLSNPDLIFPGQVLTIPGGSDAGNSHGVAEAQQQSSAEPVVETAAAESNPEPVQAAAPAPNATGQQIVDLAMSFQGAPYVWGAVGPNSFDCSGFTYYVLNQIVGGVARDMQTQASSGVAVSPDQLQPGDLVFQQNTYKAGLSHVGIYIGGGQFINAASPSTGVVVSNLWDDYWGPRFHSARRIG